MLDRFRAKVLLEDGTEETIEGGWPGFPRTWHDMDILVKMRIILELVSIWSKSPEKVKEVLTFEVLQK